MAKRSSRPDRSDTVSMAVDRLQATIAEEIDQMAGAILSAVRQELVAEQGRRQRAWDAERPAMLEQAKEEGRTPPQNPLPKDPDLIDRDFVAAMLALELDLQGFLKDVHARHRFVRSAVRSEMRTGASVVSDLARWGAMTVGVTRQNLERLLYLRPSAGRSKLDTPGSRAGRVPETTGVTREEVEEQERSALEQEQVATG